MFDLKRIKKKRALFSGKKCVDYEPGADFLLIITEQTDSTDLTPHCLGTWHLSLSCVLV